MQRINSMRLGRLGHETASANLRYPQTLTGLKLWKSATTLALADGAGVAEWRDISSSNNHVTQAAADNQPLLKTNVVNGRPVVRFDGVNDYLSVADNGSLDLQAPFSVYAVVRPNSGSSWRAVVNKSGSWWFGHKGRQLCLSVSGVGDIVTGAGTLWIEDNVTKIIQMDFDAALDTSFFVNGHFKEKVLGAANVALNNNAVFVGSSAGTSSYFSGDLLDVLVFDHLLTASERLQLCRYFANLYGLYIPVVDPDPATIVRAAAPLSTPNPYGDDQGMHPSVYDAGLGQTWNGYRYWMANTPLKDGATAAEDPCILASADGTVWVVPDGLTNPIDDTASGYFSDTELVMDNGTLWCVYRHVDEGTKAETILAKTSTDGVTWSAAVTLLTNTWNTGAGIMSPAVLWDGSRWVMWTVSMDNAVRTLQRRTASAVSGPWSAPTNCTVYRSYGAIPSLHHLGVTLVNGVYYSLITDGGVGYFMTSGDGLTWQIDRDNTLVGLVGGWDQWIYRGSLVWNGTDFDLWYGARQDAPYVAHIGRTTITGVTVP
jgi:hypothetical protein